MRRLLWPPVKHLFRHLTGSENGAVTRLRQFSSTYDNDTDLPIPPHHLPSLEPSNDADAISQIVTSHYNPFNAMESSVQLHGVSLSPHLFDQTLLRLKHSSKIALAFFHYSKSLPKNLTPLSLSSYNILVDILGRVRQFDVVWQLIVEMDQNALAPSSSTFLILIRRLISAGLTRQAIRAFDDIEAFVGAETPPSSRDFLFLLDTLCKYGHVKLAVEIFNKRRNGFVVDAKMYTVLIYGWCRIGRRDMAERFLGDMVGRGIEPTVVTYNVLLNGICRRARLHPGERFDRTLAAAEKLLGEMRARGIPPDATSLSVVAHVCSRAHKPDLTLEKLREMRQAGVAPTLATYTSAVKCLSSCGRLEEAEELLEEMRRDGIAPGGETYNCFLKEYRGRKDADGAMRLYRKMIRGEEGLSVHSCNILIGMFSRSAVRMELVREIWGDMRARGVGPDLDSYTAVVHGLCDSGRWREACEVFVEMVERGYLPQKVSFEKLYRGLIQADMLRTWRRLKKKLDLESITFGSEFHDYELKPYRR